MGEQITESPSFRRLQATAAALPIFQLAQNVPSLCHFLLHDI